MVMLNQPSKLFGSLLCISILLTSLAKAQSPTPVIVSVVQNKVIVDTVEVIGTLQANESVNLTSTVIEKVISVNFDDNQIVQQGDILIELDSSEERAELEEEQFIFNEAQKQVNRLSQLVKKGAVSTSTLDTQRRDMFSAQARINAIQARINQRMIKAPYDGVLGLRNISTGALVQPGQSITTIDDVSVMKLDFSVPEVFLSTLKPGLTIQATTEAYPEKIFNGNIKSIDSRIDPVTRSIQARALIPNDTGALKPGLLMQVGLQKNPREALIVPEEALVPNGSEMFLFVVGDDNTAERRKVKLGMRQFGQVEILEGVSAGERVVTHGVNRIRPGAPVQITATEKNNETLKQLLNQNESAQ